jgi:hypothetical protein
MSQPVMGTPAMGGPAPPPPAANGGFAAMRPPPQAMQYMQQTASHLADVTMEKVLEKEQEVASRMAQLKERQTQVIQAFMQLQPNWPPKCCCIEPIVYHDIDRAVPTDRIPFVKFSYGNYFMTIFLILYNIAAAITGVMTDNAPGNTDDTSYQVHLGIACMFLLGIPGAFLVWHFQVYQATQIFGTLNRYGTAYLGLFIGFCFAVFNTLGLVGYGGCGWLYANNMSKKKVSQAAFYVVLIGAIFWSAQCLIFVVMFFKLRRYHNEDKANRPSIAGIKLPI